MSRNKRWAGWFGIPFLVCALLAWVTDSEGLALVVMLLLGLTFFVTATAGLRTGIINVKFGSRSRWDQTVEYWGLVALFLLLGGLIVVAAIAKLLGLR